MKAEAFFADEKCRAAFNKLKKSEAEFFSHLNTAIDELEKNAFCGIQIPKRLIPKSYLQKYGIDNLWKYNLPGAFRMLYSVASDVETVVVIIIEWADHKSYERRFKY